MFAPKAWRGEYQQVVAAQLPVDGCVQDHYGVVHGVIGNFTQCDYQWTGHSPQYACDTTCKGWNMMPADTPVSCVWCLEGIPFWT